MTGYEFVEKLKQALKNDLSEAKVREQASYYRDYIREEVRKGRTEEEVTEELGDPWAIAKNIISAEELQQEGTGGYQAYEPEQNSRRQRREHESGRRVHAYGVRWWQILLLVLGMIGILALVIAVIGGIFTLLAPILVPLVVVLMIVRIFGRRQ